MKIPKLISLVTLSLVIVPCVLFFFNIISLDLTKWLTLAGTIGWFAATPLWMGRETHSDQPAKNS